MLLERGVPEITAPQLHLGGVFVHSGNAPPSSSDISLHIINNIIVPERFGHK